MAIQFNMKLADLNVLVNCRYETTKDFCSDYFCEDENFDIFASTTDKEIADESALVEGSSLNQAEQLCIYRSIAKQLPNFNRFVFHGAAITYKDKGVLFTAPSGTGKTTHIRFWKKVFGDDVLVVNGDKPILKVDENVTVYGTPWAGKENYQLNRQAPLKSICVIKRGTDNTVTRLKDEEAVKCLMQQIYLPKDPVALTKTLSLLSTLIKTVPCYVASVDMSDTAAKTTKEAIL